MVAGDQAVKNHVTITAEFDGFELTMKNALPDNEEVTLTDAREALDDLYQKTLLALNPARQ